MFTILDDIEYIGDNFCDTEGVLSVLRLVGYVLFILKVFIPIIIIYVESINFLSAVKDGTSDSLTKHAKFLIIRVAIGIMIIFIPTIIHAVLNSFIPEDSKNCEICVLKPFSCDPNDPNSTGSSNNEPTTTKTTTVKKSPTLQDKINECDGYYNTVDQTCVKKKDLTCKEFAEKASCNSAEKNYGIACSYDEVSFQCKDKTEEETVIKPSGSVITDLKDFPNDALACSLRGEVTCSGNCKWTGSSCRSNVQVSSELIGDLCKSIKNRSSGVKELEGYEDERTRCNSVDDYCTYDFGTGCYDPNGVE